MDLHLKLITQLDTLSTLVLMNIYKAFVRPDLDYGDILYEQAYNTSFPHELERMQYNACLAISGTIREASKEKLYQ